MNDIEIGDYVRSKNGSIGKVTKIEDDKYLYENKELITFIGNVVKHSKNIIDLIEVGDFVNNGYIHEVGSADNGERWVHNLNGLLLYKEDIKTILTKEQYMQNCYTVKRS